ncbi:DUF2147 domain-containing protein [Sunxiuqinia elliptica]|uniref:Uncharacterized protein DUF2147 n=1 Tax=Sunxiuqinia elliptica TaxID=655355 RepID=A0A4R6H6A0_9BACT|nr:DUF2147 domain-containing protein [Sunxiuqinia elliptica]TDO03700.1 uncharacterized protein DUF2147 [Sunxiuqinia elliptica]TDO61981.1 uncharacterized protein DUF2147 [Sunxiuqinia elliptica]
MKQLLVLGVLTLWLTTALAQKPTDITGIWWNDEKTSKIEVVEQNGNYMGTIVYMIPEKYKNGEAPKDKENPDKALRNRSIVGLQILSQLTYDAGKKEWQGGRIYDPKSGKTYDCFAWFDKDTNTLSLKGYVVGIRWLGKSTEWTRTSLN